MIPFTERGVKFFELSTLSAMFAHALQDVRACERAGNYVRHDRAPHAPERGGKVTYFTLAGSVLAITFGANRARHLYARDLGDVNVERRIDVVTFLSEGAVSSAASIFARSNAGFDAGEVWATACALHDKHGSQRGRRVPRFADVAAWDDWARSFLRELQGVGL